jgi:hypothetical protein
MAVADSAALGARVRILKPDLVGFSTRIGILRTILMGPCGMVFHRSANDLGSSLALND